MKILWLIIVTISFSIIISCDPVAIDKDYGNPPAPGFNSADSDLEAVEIADEVMAAMGSRVAWDTTNILEWTFFGRRHHTWDKKRGFSKIEIPSDSMTIWINLNSGTGRVAQNGIEVSEPDSIAKYIDRGRKMWINDSYWLVMPFKLKDSGVTLKYIGKDTTLTGNLSDVLQLTFADVGVTPDNKYLVYVDDTSRLITQWDYFANYNDSLPRFQSAWPDYKKYGDLLLSGGLIRGQRISNIKVNSKKGNNQFEGI